MATITVNRDGSERPGGFIAQKGKPFLNIVKVDVQTEFTGNQQLHDKIKATCQTSDGGAPIVITGKVLSMIPLRNRRAGIVTRIAEGMTEWNWDGKIGYGLSEYLRSLRGIASRSAFALERAQTFRIRRICDAALMIIAVTNSQA